jgi:hypothetical protein
MSTTAVTHQRIIVRLGGITAGDYLAWVLDPEPRALDDRLRSVAISAKPLGELINIDLVWAGQSPKSPSTAAVTAGFSLIPEVVAVSWATHTARRRRSSLSRTSILARSQSPFSHRSAVGCSSRPPRQPTQRSRKELSECPSTKHNSKRQGG